MSDNEGNERSPIINALQEDEQVPLVHIQALLVAGADPNDKTGYFNAPLWHASRLARFDIVKLLFESGVDSECLQWTDIFHAVAYGSLEDVKALLVTGCDLRARDTRDCTPFLIAIQTKDTAKAQALLDAGADRNDKGRGGQLPLEYAIYADGDHMLNWLLEQGFEVDEYNEFGETPLMCAAEQGAIACVQALLRAGADVFKKDRGQFLPSTAIAKTESTDIIKLLVAAGNDINDVSGEARFALLGMTKQDLSCVDKADYLQQKGRVFGQSNPELCTRQFCYAMVGANAGSWTARDFYQDTDSREAAVWCYERFGKSITLLRDGSYIEIAGEHEDYYDPDFCIYNDVFHHDGNGTFKIYRYPKDVFPPTDFHTATLVGDYIYIIGNLGYVENRLSGVTPVYRVHSKTFVMETVETTGDNPGWIHRHTARYSDKGVIRLRGGEIITLQDKKQIFNHNKKDYELCLKTLTWTQHERTYLTRTPPFFSEDYKQLRYSEGTLLTTERDGQWVLIKIINVHRVGVAKNEKVRIAGECITALEDDYLFAVVCAEGGEFESLDLLQQAVKGEQYTVSTALTAYRATEFAEHYRYISYGQTSNDEKDVFKRWLADFSSNDVEIL